MTLPRLRGVAALCVAGALACGGDSGGPGAGPTTLALSGGNNQIAPAGSTLPAPLSVLATDQAGAPVANVVISWAVGSGGGSVSAPTSTTDASGIATITRTLGPNAGTHTAMASRSGLTGSPVTFSAVAQIRGATQIAQAAAGSGNGQTDTVRATLATSYKVVVRNQSDAPVQNVIVNWTVTGGGGSVSSPSDTTDAAGLAEVTHTLGTTAGAQTVQASVTGLIGSPVTFASTATAGTAASIEIAAGNNQTGTTNGALATPYGVRAEDADGNPKQGVTITWAVQTGTGSLAPTQSITGVNGIATSTRTLGASEGTYTDTATAGSLTGSPLLFTVTAIVAPTSEDVSVANFSFTPDSVLIAQNGTVTWTWAAGSVDHNVTFQGGAGAPSSITTRSSGSDSRTFGTVGTFNYICTIHPQMTGQVVVVP